MSRQLRLAIASVPLVLAGLSAQALQRPVPTGPVEPAAISGVVLDEGTKRPVPDAVVHLGPFGAGSWREWQRAQFTDAKGRFAFADLPPGVDYAIVVQKAGYFDGSYGGSGAWEGPSIRIRLTPGEWFSDANVMLSRPGSLSGMVRDERGEPVVGVFVRALARVPVGGVSWFAPVDAVQTDDRGMYRVPNLHPGRYVVMVPSVVASVPAQADFTTLIGVSQTGIEAMRNAGLPLPSLDPLVDVDAATRLVVRGYPIPPPPDPRPLTYPMAFAGGVSADEATMHIVAEGTDLTGIDVTLAPTPAVRISGLVDGPVEARTNLALRLLPDGLEDLGFGGEAGTALVAPDGSFVFANVPAGRYVIDAAISVNQYLGGVPEIFYGQRIPPSPGLTLGWSTGGTAAAAPTGMGFRTSRLRGRTHWARTRVVAGPEGAENVVVALQPSLTASGRLIATPEPGRPAPRSRPQSIRLEAADGNPFQGTVSSGIIGNPEGSFIVGGMLPGRYVVRGDSLPWMIRSVIVDGRDHTDGAIDVSAGDVSNVIVTFTSAPASLSGIVRNEAGTPAAGAIVTVFPANPDHWTGYGLNPRRILSARASESGAFRIDALPAGDYYVVPVAAGGLRDWQQPEFFRRAQPSADRVSVAWGEARIHDVRLPRSR